MTDKHTMSASSTNGPLSTTGRRAVMGHIACSTPVFVAFFLYLWLVVELHLIFHGAGIITNFPAFYSTRLFLVEHLSYPGGPVEYLSAFVSQMFYTSWLGALAITVQAWMLYLCVTFVLGVSGSRRLSFLGYIPALLLLVLYGRYTYYVPTTMALLTALAFACVYISIGSNKTKWVGPTAFLLLSFASYYAAGGAFLLFAAVCAIYELASARRWVFGLAYAAVGMALPYVLGVLVFDVNRADAYSQLLPISWRLLDYDIRHRSVEWVYVMYLLVPATLAAAGALRILQARFHPNSVETATRKRPRDKRTRRKAVFSGYARSPRLRWLVQTALVFAAAATVAFGSLDRTTKDRFAVDYYACHEMWPEVIATGQVHRDDLSVMHAVDRALYHTGRLGNEMFQWPQRPECLLLAGTKGKRVFWEVVDIYLELGFINGAEHALTECLEGLGERPMVLQRLALANMVKDNIGTARVYLGVLSHTLFHRHWARHYLDLLDRDPDLRTDARIQQLRSVALEKDFPSVTLPTEKLLQCLLEKNSQNRMAFEYLMAWYLVTKQLNKFTEHIGEFKGLGYATLPTHFEEAALVYVYGQRKPLYLGGYDPRAEVRQRVDHFIGIMSRHQGNKQAALPELMDAHYGDYFFYFVYAQSGSAR